MGVSGLCVFSWSEEWHTGGDAIQDWAFGITYADRMPKPAYHALREVFESSVVELLPEVPSVSVVVCSYNGGAAPEAGLPSPAVPGYPHFARAGVGGGAAGDTPPI